MKRRGRSWHDGRKGENCRGCRDGERLRQDDRRLSHPSGNSRTGSRENFAAGGREPDRVGRGRTGQGHGPLCRERCSSGCQDHWAPGRQLGRLGNLIKGQFDGCQGVVMEGASALEIPGERFVVFVVGDTKDDRREERNRAIAAMSDMIIDRSSHLSVESFSEYRRFLHVSATDDDHANEVRLGKFAYAWRNSSGGEARDPAISRLLRWPGTGVTATARLRKAREGWRGGGLQRRSEANRWRSAATGPRSQHGYEYFMETSQ